MALISGLAGFNLKIEKPIRIPEELRQQKPLKRTREIIDEVKGYLKDYWKCLQ